MELDKISEIYERLKALYLDLPRDPAGLGAEFLQEQISLCRNYLNEVSHYLQAALEEESYLEMDLSTAEAEFQIESTDLLATDPRVTSRPSISDRQAMVDLILKDRRQSILGLKRQIKDLSHVKTVIMLRKKELDNTMSTLRLQRSLLNDQLRSGSFYGDEAPTSRGSVNASTSDPADAMDGDQIESLLSELENEEEESSDADDSEEDSLEEEAAGTALGEEESEEVTVDPVPQDVGVSASEDNETSSEDELDEEMVDFLSEKDPDDLEELLQGI